MASYNTPNCEHLITLLSGLVKRVSGHSSGGECHVTGVHKKMGLKLLSPHFL